MKRFTRIVLGLSLIVIIEMLTQCVSKSPYTDSIDKIKLGFSDSLLNHFPTDVKGSFRLNSTFPEQCKINQECGVFLVIKLSRDKVESLRQHIEKTEIFKTKFTNDCNIVVNPNLGELDCQSHIDSLSTRCRNLSYPIPNFPKILNETKLLVPQENIQIDKFEIFILSSKPGAFVDSTYLSDGCGLPREWKNGYSKGIAINYQDLELIYWIEIW